MIFVSSDINIKSIVSVVEKDVLVSSSINSHEIFSKQILFDDNIALKFQKRINIDSDNLKFRKEKTIGISTYLNKEVVSKQVNIENISAPNFEYYSNVLYAYNNFISENAKVLYEIFSDIVEKTDLNDLNFDLFLEKLDDKDIKKFENITKIF